MPLVNRQNFFYSADKRSIIINWICSYPRLFLELISLCLSVV